MWKVKDMWTDRTWSSGRRSFAAVTVAALLLAGCAAGGPSRTTPGVPDAEASLGAYAVAAQRTLEHLPDDTSARWTDPSDGTVLRLTVLATETGPSGLTCRRVRIAAVDDADGSVQRFCRDAEAGLWVFTPVEPA